MPVGLHPALAFQVPRRAVQTLDNRATAVFSRAWGSNLRRRSKKSQGCVSPTASAIAIGDTHRNTLRVAQPSPQRQSRCPHNVPELGFRCAPSGAGELDDVFCFCCQSRERGPGLRRCGRPIAKCDRQEGTQFWHYHSNSSTCPPITTTCAFTPESARAPGLYATLCAFALPTPRASPACKDEPLGFTLLRARIERGGLGSSTKDQTPRTSGSES